MIVGIDGPAGSGKGTVTKIISQRMGLVNLDTGATYRCVALESIRRNIPITKEEEITSIIDDLKIEFEHDDNGNITVLLNGEDVSKEIRSTEVSSIVSPMSNNIALRAKMVELQRKMAEGKDVIVEGRDICTVVFPNADVKIYLDAEVEERARRRFKENQEKGIECTYEEVLESIKKRDENDKSKEVGALKVAEGATIVDSTNLSIEEMADEVERVIRTKM